ncbi:MAG: hypothetical protein WCA35_17245 [Kovacikia sp.]
MNQPLPPGLKSKSDRPTELAAQSSADQPSSSVFRISPLIRLTLLCLYIALTIPLPFLSKITSASILSPLLWVGIGLGGIVLGGALSERVILNQQGIQVTYAGWVPRLFRRGWALSWSEIQALKPRSTGQGGLVYYFVSHTGQGYLLPMRVAGFASLVRQVEARTGIDTREVRPLSQPWMYFILLGCTLFLLIIDGWAIWMVVGQNY